MTLCLTKYFAVKRIPKLLRYALAVFLLGNVVCFCLLITEASFGAIGRMYNYNTIAAPVFLILASAISYTVWRIRPDSKHHFHSSIGCLVISLLLIATRVYASEIEPKRLVIRHVTIESDKVSEPLTILHVSDIQCNRIDDYEDKVFAKMRNLSPDIIIFTGDMLQPQEPNTVDSELPKLSYLMSTLDPKYGVYGVYGDVDWRIINIPEEKLGGINMLKNESVSISTDSGPLSLFGMMCPDSKDELNPSKAMSKWLKGSSPEEITIALGHSPDYAVYYKDHNIDLCLAGHTHGGQVRIPFLGPIVTLSDAPRSWARGYREVGNIRLNVSAGAGCEHADNIPEIRFSCPSEMTLIKFTPSK